MKFPNLGHRLPSGFMSIKIAVGSVLFVVILGIIGFMALENYTFVEAFYMTIITISTVGFTEVRALQTSGQLFASFLIILNIGVFAYALAVFSYFIGRRENFSKYIYGYDQSTDFRIRRSRHCLWLWSLW